MKIIKKILSLPSIGKLIKKVSSFSRFEPVLDYMPDSFIIIDRRGIVTDVNKACCDLLGYTREEIIGQSASMFFVRKTNGNGMCLYPTKEDDEIYLGKILDELVLNGYVNDLEVVFVTKDCRRIPMLFNGVVLRGADGEITGVLGIARDMRRITRYIEKLRFIRELAMMSFGTIGIEKIIEQLFGLMKKYFRVERGTVYIKKGNYIKSIFAAGYPSDEPIVLEVGRGIAGYVALTRQTYYTNDAYSDEHFDKEIDQRTGYRTHNILAKPLLDENGELIGVAEILNKDGDFTNEDVSDFEEMVKLAKIILMNKYQRDELKSDIAAITLISDVSNKALSPSPIQEFISYALEKLGCYLESDNICLYEYKYKNGGIIEKICSFPECNDKKQDQATIHLRDLGDDNKWLTEILMSGKPVCFYDGSPSVKEVFQDTDITMLTFETIKFCGLIADSRCKVLMPLVVKNKYWGFMCVDFTGFISAHRRVSERDISVLKSVAGTISWELERDENKKESDMLNAHLAQSARLVSVGELAAGVAHEIGNPLQTILGNAELLRMNHSDSEELKSIVDASLQCRQIIENLLDFARAPRNNSVTHADINEIIARTISLFGKQLKLGKIQVVTNLDRNLPGVTVSIPQISQVFMNIITNARKAMPQGGTLTITTYVREYARDIAGNINTKESGHLPLTLHPNEKNKALYVVAEFTDTGVGIKPELIPRLFEPFFTTRKDGTGLGLSVSYGIVKRHNGEILIRSEGEGKGATVKVLLPVRSNGNNLKV